MIYSYNRILCIYSKEWDGFLYIDMKGTQDTKILLHVCIICYNLCGEESTYPHACTCRESSGTILTLVPHL